MLHNLLYALTGPFWPEYLVARELRRKGWKVYRHFCVYDPKHHAYAEMDILAISASGLLMIEVKSYRGEWESLDYEEKPKWRKIGSRHKNKSPIWQVKRSRLALINTLLADFPGITSNIIAATQTYVFLDRGKVINATDPRVIKAWSDMKVRVGPLARRTDLPEAGPPAAPAFLNWAESYYRHFRWKRWYKKAKNDNQMADLMAGLQQSWQLKKPV